MKLRIGAFLVILSTAAVIGVMTLLVNKTTTIDSPKASESKEALENKKPSGKTHSHNETVVHEKVVLKDEVDQARAPQEEKEDSHDNDELTKEDIQKINSIASLSETDLAKELGTLKERIEGEDLFGQLEEGLLPKDREAEAKETLERFALLGLEGTRRKYMAIEPELKDPIFAYKDSLREIRELLNDDYDDE